MATNTIGRSGVSQEESLRLHRRLQPIVARLSSIPGWIVLAAAAAAASMLFLVNRCPFSLLPFSGLALYSIFAFATLLPILQWQENITTLSRSGDIAAVGPLLDFAEGTFLDPHDSSRKPKPKSEAIVLNALPDLLARMPAGDCPDLTPRQRSTLNRLSQDYRYQSYFSPELCNKIEAIVNQNR